MSELRANTLSDAAGTGPATLTAQYAAKAAFNYDQTVPSVERDDNVSSISDDGTGSFTVTFTNGFDDAKYSIGGHVYGASSTSGGVLTSNSSQAPTSSAAPLTTESVDASNFDYNGGGGIFVGDLA